MIEDLVEEAKNDLLNLKKTTEKQVIRLWVASRSHATSETRKSIMEELRKQANQSFKTASQKYENSFSDAAKGKWVDQAKKSMEKIMTDLEIY